MQYIGNLVEQKNKITTAAMFSDLAKDIRDMDLTFTLPGYPEIILCENGAEVLVELSNIETYYNVPYFLAMVVRIGFNRPSWTNSSQAG